MHTLLLVKSFKHSTGSPNFPLLLDATAFAAIEEHFSTPHARVSTCLTHFEVECFFCWLFPHLEMKNSFLDGASIINLISAKFYRTEGGLSLVLWILRESENSAEFILETKTMFYYSLINTRYLFCIYVFFFIPGR